MKAIPLTKGKAAIVDDAWYEELSQYRWYYSSSGYACRTVYVNGVRQEVLMHRVIAGAKEGEVVDHINGDKLDNREENLRVCSHTENMANTKMYTTNKTGYKGVHYHKATGKYRVTISVNNKTKHVGLYKTAEEAALAYNEAALKYHGVYAKLNQI